MTQHMMFAIDSIRETVLIVRLCLSRPGRAALMREAHEHENFINYTDKFYFVIFAMCIIVRFYW